MPTGPDYGSSDPKFNLWRQQTNVLDDVTGQAYAKVNLTGVDSPEQVQAARVTSAYFRLVGLPLAKGRSFTAEEDHPNGRRIMVLSDGFSKRHFGSDPRMIGMNITLAGNPYEVVGVAAPGTETEAQTAPDLWIPCKSIPLATAKSNISWRSAASSPE
jgi:putative ABC transport system permease protein